MSDGLGTASWLELFFILIGVVAIFYNWRNYRFYASILRTVKRLNQNGYFLLQARKDRRHEAERLGLQALLLTTGIIAAFLPEPQNPSVNLGRMVSQVISVGFQLYLLLSSYRDARDNETQNKYLNIGKPAPTNGTAQEPREE